MMRPFPAPGNQTGARLPAPLPRSADAGERSLWGVAARPIFMLPAHPFRLRSHPAGLPFARLAERSTCPSLADVLSGQIRLRLIGGSRCCLS